MIILDNSKNSAEHPNSDIVMEFHSNLLQDLCHGCLKENYSQLLLNLRIWNKVHLDDHLALLSFSYDECDDYAKEIKSRQAHVVIHQKSKNLNIVDTSLNWYQTVH